jgi:TfoX/Sxy family transcriptional regulator of competence genes
MFGEYMAYVNDKPILLVCDNTVYIKQHECLAEMMKESEKGIPYTGAKEHYIVDIDNRELCNEIIRNVEPLVKVPKSKNSIKKE